MSAGEALSLLPGVIQVGERQCPLQVGGSTWLPGWRATPNWGSHGAILVAFAHDRPRSPGTTPVD
jgi:hypothetical protein